MFKWTPHSLLAYAAAIIITWCFHDGERFFSGSVQSSLDQGASIVLPSLMRIHSTAFSVSRISQSNRQIKQFEFLMFLWSFCDIMTLTSKSRSPNLSWCVERRICSLLLFIRTQLNKNWLIYDHISIFSVCDLDLIFKVITVYAPNRTYYLVLVSFISNLLSQKNQRV